MIPRFLQPFTKPLKTGIKALCFQWLRRSRLSGEQALRWAERFKTWPGVFDSVYQNRVALHDPDFVMELGLIDVIERELTVKGVWDKPVLDELKSRLQPGDVFIDIGANIGYFSLVASRLVGAGGRVYSFEPSPINVGRLARHLTVNSVENTSILSVGLGHEDEEVRLHFPTRNNAGASTIRAIEAGASMQSHPIVVRRLDSIVPEWQRSPKLIKIDIEGAELNALKGMEKLLREHRPTVLCEMTGEFLQDMDASIEEMLLFMENLGYGTTRLGDLHAGEARQLIADDPKTWPNHQIDVVFEPVKTRGQVGERR